MAVRHTAPEERSFSSRIVSTLAKPAIGCYVGRDLVELVFEGKTDTASRQECVNQRRRVGNGGIVRLLTGVFLLLSPAKEKFHGR